MQGGGGSRQVSSRWQAVVQAGAGGGRCRPCHGGRQAGAAQAGAGSGGRQWQAGRQASQQVCMRGRQVWSD